MKQADLSIVIPTRNRPVELQKTVESLIKQSHRNLEIVVVDNSDNEESEVAIREFEDIRIRIVRTGGLNMPDNWEAALRAATGKFVMVSNDKTLHRSEAAEIILTELEKTKAAFITWTIGPATSNFEKSISAAKIKNADILQYALRCRIDLFQRFAPRGTNCAIRRNYLDECFQRHHVLCRPISPDYSLSTFLLSGCEFSAHLSVNLASIICAAPSNTHVMQNSPGALGAYYATLGIKEEHMLQFVPVRTFLINNVLLNDVLSTLNETGFNVPPIDRYEYALLLLSDLVILKREGRPWEIQVKELREWICIQGKSYLWELARHLFQRFIEGWPNRKLRMRENFPDAMKALRIIAWG